jgi:hypothetical protein
MAFVRSRKGRGNSDFVRARRQQDFVIAALRRVLKRGSGSSLSSLINRATVQSRTGALTTNVPLTSANALELFRLLDGADLDFQVVFRAPTYASHIPGGTAYELDLAAVRRVTRDWFGSTGAPPPRGQGPATDPAAPRPSFAPVATPDASTAPTSTPQPASSGSPATPEAEVVAPPVGNSDAGGQADVAGSPASEFGPILLVVSVLALILGVATIALMIRRLRLGNLPDRP